MHIATRILRATAAFFSFYASAATAYAEDPPLFYYDETTTVLVDNFAEHLGPWGPQGQPLANDAEFVKWFVSYADGAPLRDVNGDNLIDCEDITGIVVRLLRGLRGDLDGDGAVGPSDVALLTANLGRTWTPQDPVQITDGDLTGDGAVMPDDLQKLMGVGHGPLDGLAEDVAERFVFGRPESLCADPNWTAHNTYFSGSWPGSHSPFHSSVNPGTHTVMVSGGPRPPGHHYGLSTTWPGSGHSVADSNGSGYPPPGWPANHDSTMSGTWDDNGSHLASVSRRWPSSHTRAISEGWGPDSTHAFHTSLGWGPNHRLAISYSPPVHIASASVSIVPRSPHQVEISASHDDVVPHSTSTSSAWPPSHVGFITRTWAPGDNGHSMNVSGEWPSGHFNDLSGSWPPHTNPRWPPNHYASTSNSWGDPPPPSTPIWPPEHSYIMTVLELIDVISGL